MSTGLAIPASMHELIEQVSQQLSQRPKLATLFRNCFPNTLTTTMQPQPDGSTFVITGDIPAMWLRDSAAQVRPYLILAERDPAIADLIAGVVKRQMAYIVHDPYANAFNQQANGNGHQNDNTAMTSLIWERKYEIDSLCYPLQLSYLLWRATGCTDHFDELFCQAAEQILALWKREQDHTNNSSYTFERSNCPPTDTLANQGKGTPVAPTGMTWSGFRPSDDACIYGYLVPANMFAVVVLGYLSQIAEQVLHDPALAQQARTLASQIDRGIREHAVVQHPCYGQVYAYEVDGLGNANFMDDANVPSLLSAPYLGYCANNDPIYQQTRRLILSAENPYYYSGSVASGIGSPHTPANYIWHIALSMQALTSDDPTEIEQILTLIENTDADTGYMHEGFHVDNPAEFTRPGFAWSNSLMSELVLKYCGYQVKC